MLYLPHSLFYQLSLFEIPNGKFMQSPLPVLR